jgi:PKD repeat protein
MNKKFTFFSLSTLGRLLFVLFMLFYIGNIKAQTISTTSSFSNNNGSGVVTFNFQNTNAFPVTITSISSVLRATDASTFKLWYKTTVVNGLPGVISAGNGWTLSGSGTFTSTIGSTTNQVIEPVLTGLSLVIPANTSYGLAVSGFATVSGLGTMGYYSIPATPATVTFSGGGCNIITGENISYAATTEAGSATFTPRGFVGSITFNSAPAPTCAAPTIPTATSITSTTASLNWTQTGTPAQWQIKYGAAGFNPATAGTSILTSVKPYTLNPPLTPVTSYDYYVRAICGPADTSAWSVVKNFSTLCNAPALLTTKDSNRCGTGEVILQATAAPGATIKWYANATGGSPLGTGGSFTTPNIASTTTYHVAASSGSSGAGVIRITEMGLGDPDALEIQNVGSLPVDVTGWKVALSDSYTSITAVNTIIQTLSGTMAANDIKTWTDLSSNTNYWGNNIFWNPGAATSFNGWALILDNNNNLVDFVAFNWPVATIQATTLTIGAASVSLATAWTGSSLDANPAALSSGSNFQRIGNADLNQATDFNVATATVGTTNTGLTLPFGGSACESARLPVVATIKAIPTLSLPNDTSICPGISYTFNAGNPGATYAWSTGATTQSIAANAAGTYSVLVTTSNGCAKSDTVIITPGIVPVNNLPAITNLCAGEMATLNAGNAGSSFIWTPGNATTQAINVNTAGNYSVNIKSTTGCKITSTTNLIIRPLPVPSLGNDTSICDGAQITLNAGNPGHTFSWNTGATTQTINITDSGTYTVVVTSPYNCILEEDKHIAYLPSPRVEGFNFIPLFYEQLGKVKFSPLNPTNVNSYEWDFGDGTPSSVQMNPEHHYTSGGNYLVTLKVFNGCGNFEISLPINVDLTTGIITLNAEAADVTLYPNPSRDYITIENKSDNLKMQEVSVFSALGAMVYTHHADNGKSHKLNVTQLASGLYSVRILTDKGFIVRKFEVMR